MLSNVRSIQRCQALCTFGRVLFFPAGHELSRTWKARTKCGVWCGRTCIATNRQELYWNTPLNTKSFLSWPSFAYALTSLYAAHLWLIQHCPLSFPQFHSYSFLAAACCLTPRKQQTERNTSFHLTLRRFLGYVHLRTVFFCWSSRAAGATLSVLNGYQTCKNGIFLGFFAFSSQQLCSSLKW